MLCWCQETATRGDIEAVAGMHAVSGDNMICRKNLHQNTSIEVILVQLIMWQLERFSGVCISLSIAYRNFLIFKPGSVSEYSLGPLQCTLPESPRSPPPPPSPNIREQYRELQATCLLHCELQLQCIL